jgi:hypothetical protein
MSLVRLRILYDSIDELMLQLRHLARLFMYWRKVVLSGNALQRKVLFCFLTRPFLEPGDSIRHGANTSPRMEGYPTRRIFAAVKETRGGNIGVADHSWALARSASLVGAVARNECTQSLFTSAVLPPCPVSASHSQR